MRFSLGGLCVGLLAPVLVFSCTGTPDESEVQSEVASGPDLTELNVTLSGSAGTTYNMAVGGTFGGADTAQNTGSAAAPATTTRYWLSPDGVTKTTRPLGSRAVAGLAINGSDSGSAALTVPTGTTDGDYSVLACADALNGVGEQNEMNNCTQAMSGSTPFTVRVASPDLYIASLSSPPAALNTGDTFSAVDATTNQGAGPAADSVTRFYLSSNGTDLTFFLGHRDVAALGAGVGPQVTTTLTIPANTGVNSFYVLACSDSTRAVAESVETNNCLASSSRVAINGPDLTEEPVTVDATLVSSGSNGTVNVTEGVHNVGLGAGGSTTRFFLSADPTWDGQDMWVIPGCVQTLPWADKHFGRSVPPIPAGQSESPVTTPTHMCFAGHDAQGSVTLMDVPAGSYYLIACADDGNANSGLIAETVENNNCSVTSSQLTVTLCGNGTVDAGEQCDDGNLSDTDRCSSTCQFIGNQAPVITSTAPTTAFVGVQYTYNATATDADGPSQVWSKDPGDTCTSSTIDPSTGIYTFTPAAVGNCVVGVQVCDNGLPNECTSQLTPVSYGSQTLHISALSGVATDFNASYWMATVTVTVHDELDQPVGGVAVSGAWNPTQTETGKNCTTAANGTCQIVTRLHAFAQSIPSETWSVSHLKLTGYVEDFSANVASQVTLNNP